VRLAWRIADAPPLQRWGNLPMTLPHGASDRSIARFLRNNLMTTFHFAGTCRMGSDERAVVTPQLQLRGVAGVRVADASIMPTTPVSALNAPSMLIGYRAAQWIKAEA